MTGAGQKVSAATGARCAITVDIGRAVSDVAKRVSASIEALETEKQRLERDLESARRQIAEAADALVRWKKVATEAVADARGLQRSTPAPEVDALVARWSKLPEAVQNVLAGNFFPELLQDQPEAILRSVARALGEAEDTAAVDAGTLTLSDYFARRKEVAS